MHVLFCVNKDIINMEIDYSFQKISVHHLTVQNLLRSFSKVLCIKAALQNHEGSLGIFRMLHLVVLSVQNYFVIKKMFTILNSLGFLLSILDFMYQIYISHEYHCDHDQLGVI